MDTSEDVTYNGGYESPPRIGFSPSALPEVQKSSVTKNSDTGVSTRSVCLSTNTITEIKSQSHWYALRATYGREKKAYDYIVEHGGTAFYPTIFEERTVKGRKTQVEVARIPNIFFAYGSEETIQRFVYDNVNLPFLRFYYRHFHEGRRIKKEPLIVPDNQIDSLKIICMAQSEDTVFVTQDIMKFHTGQMVRIIEGTFSGVIGRVARFLGQQRVGIVVDGLLTATTAYIPSAFLEKIDA